MRELYQILGHALPDEDTTRKLSLLEVRRCGNEHIARIVETGAEEVRFVGLDNCYIDHDSMGILDSDKESLKQFIFNKNSWLFGGNDNSTADPTFYHVPEFKDWKQIVPRYKYELKVEGFNETTKFLEYPSQDSLESGLSALLDDVYLSENGYFDNDNSIMAQLNRDDRKYFRYSWRKSPDLENKIVYFVLNFELSFSRLIVFFFIDVASKKKKANMDGGPAPLSN
jgi:hypothetical protein